MTASSLSRLPRPGEVIAYDYLWSREAARGQENGTKSRPCLILQTHVTDSGLRVYVVPITSERSDVDEGMEVPLQMADRLMLRVPCWVLWSELNYFDWPGPDLRAAPGPGREPAWLYGLAPAGLHSKVLRAFLIRQKAGRTKFVMRT